MIGSGSLRSAVQHASVERPKRPILRVHLHHGFHIYFVILRFPFHIPPHHSSINWRSRPSQGQLQSKGSPTRSRGWCPAPYGSCYNQLFCHAIQGSQPRGQRRVLARATLIGSIVTLIQGWSGLMKGTSTPADPVIHRICPYDLSA